MSAHVHPWVVRGLALDASTGVGTVAVLRDGAVVAARDVAMRGEREERLMPAVVDALADAAMAPTELTGIVCGAGPGGFTGLRIAASIAKGLAQAADAPLWAMPSLALAAAAAPDASRCLVALDALRGESYAALVTRDGAAAMATHASLGIVATADLARLAREHDALLVAGVPHARDVTSLAALVRAVDLDGWEPDYGRKAEAQVKWEIAHGRSLPTSAGTPG